MNKRKVLAAFGALLLAIVSALALVRYVQGAEERAIAGEDLVDTLVVTGDIKAGTPASEFADRVATEAVQAKVRPDNAVRTFQQIDGLVAAVDLVKGEQLLTSRFVNPGAAQSARSSSALLPKGANEVTFKLAAERALGGQLRPGDAVTVLASFDKFDEKTPGADALNAAATKISTHALLNRATVVRIQFPTNADSSTKEKNGVGVAPTEDLLVTLAVDQPSLERAVFAAEFGKVWLSYEPAGADSSQNRLVTRENVYEPTPSLLPATPASSVFDAVSTSGTVPAGVRVTSKPAGT